MYLVKIPAISNIPVQPVHKADCGVHRRLLSLPSGFSFQKGFRKEDGSGTEKGVWMTGPRAGRCSSPVILKHFNTGMHFLEWRSVQDP